MKHHATTTLTLTDRAFKGTMARVRQVLQSVDTARFWIVDGPRIVKFRTATYVRDSVALVERVRMTRAQIDTMMRVGRFSSITVKDYSRLRLYSGYTGGGSITGFLDRGGVTLDTGAVVHLEVECEARRGSKATFQGGYLSVSDLRYSRRNKFLCLWSGDDASEWQEVQPNEYHVRLLATIGLDSITGPWIEARR